MIHIESMRWGGGLSHVMKAPVFVLVVKYSGFVAFVIIIITQKTS